MSVESLLPAMRTRRRLSGWTWCRRLLSSVGVAMSVVWVLAVGALALLAPYLPLRDPNRQVLRDTYLNPSRAHMLGTDDVGRDLASRLLWGGRVSLTVSLLVVLFVLLIAVPVGLVAGYAGGKLDSITMRIVDAGLSFPPLVLAMAVAAALGRNVTNVVIALTIVSVPQMIRLVRGEVLAVREESFVEASKTLGTPVPRVLARRILPNAASAILVASTFTLSGAMLAEAGLSFLGVGVQPPTASWGSMLRRAYDRALFKHQWELVVPGVAIALTVLAFNVVGDALQDALGRKRTTAGPPQRRGLTPATHVPAAAPTAPSATDPVLRIEGLEVSYGSRAIVEGVSFDIGRGEIVGLVGESGSGKSMTALSVMRLVPPPLVISAGSIRFNGTELLALSFDEMRAVRGAGISLIFQDPMSSLNPVFKIGNQLVEAIRLHEKVKPAAARARAVELLERVGIADPASRMDAYPHQLSGGMRQRVMIAMAVACRPKLLIADEPTTALDVTIQAQVLDLLRELRDEFEMSILLITHDLGVVADVCDRAAVMYAGEVVETASTEELFAHPRHPYTEGLLAAMPQVGKRTERLTVIPGQVPTSPQRGRGCVFHERCDYGTDDCRSAPIDLTASDDGHEVRCRRAPELVLRGPR